MADRGRPPKIIPHIPGKFEEIVKAVVTPLPKPEKKDGAQ